MVELYFKMWKKQYLVVYSCWTNVLIVMPRPHLPVGASARHYIFLLRYLRDCLQWKEVLAIIKTVYLGNHSLLVC